MPCLYAHYTFGQKVKNLLPEEVQECISNYEEQFNLGLQGPDFLFYFRPLGKNPVNRLGHKIHKKTGAFYIKKILPTVRRKGQFSPETAYLLGFLCHFLLDSRCHPYVNQKAEELDIKHVDLEGEFDKFLLIKKRGVRPERYPLWRHIPVDSLTVDTLTYMYPWVSRRYLRAALFSFRFYKWLMTAQNPIKKQFLIVTMKCLGLYEKLRGHYLWDERLEGTEMVSIGLNLHLQEEIPVAVELLEDIWEQIGRRGEVKLSPRFYMDFSGKNTRRGQEDDLRRKSK